MNWKYEYQQSLHCPHKVEEAHAMCHTHGFQFNCVPVTGAKSQHCPALLTAQAAPSVHQSLDVAERWLCGYSMLLGRAEPLPRYCKAGGTCSNGYNRPRVGCGLQVGRAWSKLTFVKEKLFVSLLLTVIFRVQMAAAPERYSNKQNTPEHPQ